MKIDTDYVLCIKEYLLDGDEGAVVLKKGEYYEVMERTDESISLWSSFGGGVRVSLGKGVEEFDQGYHLAAQWALKTFQLVEGVIR